MVTSGSKLIAAGPGLGRALDADYGELQTQGCRIGSWNALIHAKGPNDWRVFEVKTLPAGLIAPWHLQKKEVVQALCFAVVGGIGYLVNLLTFGALRVLVESPYLLAATIAFLAAANCNFLLNRAFTFGERSRPLHRGVRSLLTATLVLGVNLLLLHWLVQASVSVMLAQAAAVLLVVPLNYALHQRWVFA